MRLECEICRFDGLLYVIEDPDPDIDALHTVCSFECGEELLNEALSRLFLAGPDEVNDYGHDREGAE